MTDLKIVVWNVEWMNDLFVPNRQTAAFKPDDDEPTHSPGATIKQRREDLAGVLQELAPDLVVVVEGPNRPEELQLFFDEDMPGDWRTSVQISQGQTQNVGLAVRVDEGKFQDQPFLTFDTNAVEAFDPFVVDVDDDGILEQYRFERRPLYAEVRPRDGAAFRVLGLHLKSKGIFGAYEWSKWWKIADANRKKILAQATQIRLNFLDTYLATDETKDIPLIVCGDINDGPGLDASEKRLFGSGVERLMGSVWKPETCLSNALFDTLSERDQQQLEFSKIYTASFADPIFNRTYHRVWIDHILYYPRRPWVTEAGVYLDTWDGQKIYRKYPFASDHFPVSAVVKV